MKIDVLVLSLALLIRASQVHLVLKLIQTLMVLVLVPILGLDGAPEVVLLLDLIGRIILTRVCDL